MKRSSFLFALIFLMHFCIQIKNCKAQWVQMSSGMGNQNVTCMVASGNNIFAGTDSLYLSGGIYISTNNGMNWTKTTFPPLPVWSLAAIGNNILVGTAGGGILYSSDNGISWTISSLTNRVVFDFTVLGNNIFAGTNEFGVYISTNNGVNWTIVNFLWHAVFALTTRGNNVFAGTNGVFKSTDNGSNWIQTFLDTLTVHSFAVIGNNIFAGTTGDRVGVFLSTNDGTSWTQTSLNNKDILSLATSGNNIFAGSDTSGIYLSTNNGINWAQINQGLNNSPKYRTILIKDNYIFTGTSDQSIWRRPLSEVLSIQNISTEAPLKYSLSQNYPNPFNSTSNLKFEITNTGDIKLIVYDIMGKEVQTLVHERLKPGTYETSFDGSTLNSGVYFYKLVIRHGGSSTGFSETKKMLLIK